MINQISPTEATTLLNLKKTILLAGCLQYAAEHIEGSLLAPLSDLQTAFEALALSPETPLIMQCRSGARSQKAILMLTALGVRNPMTNLEGGIEAWKSHNLPTATASA